MMNCSVDPNASYGQFLYTTYTFFNSYMQSIDHNKNEIKTWFLMRFTLAELAFICILILFWNYSRRFYMQFVCQPYCKFLRVDAKDVRKTKENIWALTGDVALWIYVLCLIQRNDENCNLFLKPSQIFKDIKKELPFKIQLFYFLFISKYIFNIYAVIKLDEKRKDFLVMIMHHIVTLILLTIGYISRVYKSGLIVTLIHNLCDLFLTSAKISLYSKPQSKLGQKVNYYLFRILAAKFTFFWIINRLYLYPLRAIYYLGFFSVNSPEVRIFGIAYLLLIAIFFMDLYWTYYIYLFLWRVFAYKQKLHDPISDEVELEQSNQTKLDSIKKTKIN